MQAAWGMQAVKAEYNGWTEGKNKQNNKCKKYITSLEPFIVESWSPDFNESFCLKLSLTLHSLLQTTILQTPGEELLAFSCQEAAFARHKVSW